MLQQFATAGGGSRGHRRRPRGRRSGLRRRRPRARVAGALHRPAPAGRHRRPGLVVTGVASAVAVHGDGSALDLGAAAPVVAPTDDADGPPRRRRQRRQPRTALTATVSGVLPAARRPGPVPRACSSSCSSRSRRSSGRSARSGSRRSRRTASVGPAPRPSAAKASPSAISQSWSTWASSSCRAASRPAGRWRSSTGPTSRGVPASGSSCGSSPCIVGGLVGYVLLARTGTPWWAWSSASSPGSSSRPCILRYPRQAPRQQVRGRAPRRAHADATSLASGFSLLQALDAVARDAPEPVRQGVLAGAGRDPDRRRRLGRPRAHGRPHGQQEHALGDHGDPHPARGRRQPGRDAAHHRCDAARARGAAPPRARRCRRRAGSPPTSSSRCPSAAALLRMWTNYDYVSLLWTTLYGIVMIVGGLIAWSSASSGCATSSRSRCDMGLLLLRCRPVRRWRSSSSSWPRSIGSTAATGVARSLELLDTSRHDARGGQERARRPGPRSSTRCSTRCGGSPSGCRPAGTGEPHRRGRSTRPATRPAGPSSGSWAPRASAWSSASCWPCSVSGFSLKGLHRRRGRRRRRLLPARPPASTTRA